MKIIDNSLKQPGIPMAVVYGGKFSKDGWQVIGDDDRIIFDTNKYINNGSVEFTVTNFDPGNQLKNVFAHWVGMFKTYPNHHCNLPGHGGWVNHAVRDNRHSPDGQQQKLLTFEGSDNEYGDEQFTEGLKWDAKKKYRIRFTWNHARVVMSVDGTSVVGTSFHTGIQGRFLCIGSDLTVAESRKNFAKPGGNRYAALIGPVYSDLVLESAGFDAIASIVDLDARDPMTGFGAIKLSPICDTTIQAKGVMTEFFGWNPNADCIEWASQGLAAPIILRTEHDTKGLIVFDTTGSAGKVPKSATLSLVAHAFAKNKASSVVVEKLPDVTYVDENLTVWHGFDHPNGLKVGNSAAVNPGKVLPIQLHLPKLGKRLVLQLSANTFGAPEGCIFVSRWATSGAPLLSMTF